MSAFVFLVYRQMEHVAPALQGSERKLLTTGVTVSDFQHRTSILICIARTYSATGIQKTHCPHEKHAVRVANQWAEFEVGRLR